MYKFIIIIIIISCFNPFAGIFAFCVLLAFAMYRIPK